MNMCLCLLILHLRQVRRALARVHWHASVHAPRVAACRVCLITYAFRLIYCTTIIMGSWASLKGGEEKGMNACDWGRKTARFALIRETEEITVYRKRVIIFCVCNTLNETL